MTLLIAVAIYNDRLHHSVLPVKTFDLNHGLIVELHPFPVSVEEQTQFSVRLKEDSVLSGITVKKAWIEGVNMYMGRTTVFLEKPEGQNIANGWFFLGSCSEPTMQWRLFIAVETDKGEEIMSFDFFTQV